MIIPALIQCNYERILRTVVPGTGKEHYKAKRHSVEILLHNGARCLLCYLQKIKTFSLFDCVRSFSLRPHLLLFSSAVHVCESVPWMCVMNNVDAFVFYKFNSYSFRQPKCTIVLRTVVRVACGGYFYVAIFFYRIIFVYKFLVVVTSIMIK